MTAKIHRAILGLTLALGAAACATSTPRTPASESTDREIGDGSADRNLTVTAEASGAIMALDHKTRHDFKYKVSGWAFEKAEQKCRDRGLEPTKDYDTEFVREGSLNPAVDEEYDALMQGKNWVVTAQTTLRCVKVHRPFMGCWIEAYSDREGGFLGVGARNVPVKVVFMAQFKQMSSAEAQNNGKPYASDGDMVSVTGTLQGLGRFPTHAEAQAEVDRSVAKGRCREVPGKFFTP